MGGAHAAGAGNGLESAELATARCATLSGRDRRQPESKAAHFTIPIHMRRFFEFSQCRLVPVCTHTAPQERRQRISVWVLRCEEWLNAIRAPARETSELGEEEPVLDGALSRPRPSTANNQSREQSRTSPVCAVETMRMIVSGDFRFHCATFTCGGGQGVTDWVSRVLPVEFELGWGCQMVPGHIEVDPAPGSPNAFSLRFEGGACVGAGGLGQQACETCGAARGGVCVNLAVFDGGGTPPRTWPCKPWKLK